MTITIVLSLPVASGMMSLWEPLNKYVYTCLRVISHRCQVVLVVFAQVLASRDFYLAQRPVSRRSGYASCFLNFPSFTHLVPVFPDCQIGPKPRPNTRTVDRISDPSPSYLMRVNHVFSASQSFSNPIDSQIYKEFICCSSIRTMWSLHFPCNSSGSVAVCR